MILRCELPSLNKYIAADKYNRYKGGELKRNATQDVMWEVKDQMPKGWVKLSSIAHFTFIWHCKNRKEDPDNIAFCKKYIMDGFQESGLISQDGWKNVLGFEDQFEIDSKDPRIEIIIKY